MPTPHPHAAVIKAWADDTSQVVQCRHDDDGEWQDLTLNPPIWNQHTQYRIKPAPVALSFHNAYSNGVIGSFRHASRIAADQRSRADNIERERVAVIEIRDNGDVIVHKDV